MICADIFGVPESVLLLMLFALALTSVALLRIHNRTPRPLRFQGRPQGPPPISRAVSDSPATSHHGFGGRTSTPGNPRADVIERGRCRACGHAGPIDRQRVPACPRCGTTWLP